MGDADSNAAGAWRRTVAYGAASAAAFVVAHPLIWRAGPDGQLRPLGEFQMQEMWADLVFARGSLSAGQLPLWNPWERGGYAFFSDPASGMFDPLTWVTLLVAMLLGSVPVGLLVAKTVAAYAIAGSGVATFLRQRQLPSWAVALGTLALLWSPAWDGLKDGTGMGPIMWLGWLFLVTERGLARPTVRRGLALGAVAGLTVAAGDPAMTWRIAILWAPWTATRAAHHLDLLAWVAARSQWIASLHDGAEPRPELDRVQHLRSLGRAAAVATLVFAGLAIGPWSTWDLQVPVAAGKTPLLDRGHAWAWFSGAPDEVLPLVVGFALAAGAIIAVVAKRRAEPIALLSSAAIAFAMAITPEHQVWATVQQLPSFHSARGVVDDLTLAAVGVALAGTFGLSRAGQLKGEARWAAAGIAGFGVSGWATHAEAITTTGALIIASSAALVIGLAFAAPHRHRTLGWLLVIATAADVWVASRPVADRLVAIVDPKPGRALADALGDDDAREVYRVADLGWDGNRVGSHHGVRDIAGRRRALNDIRVRELDELARRSSNLLRAMNVAVVGFAGRVSGSELTRDLEAVRKQRGLFTVVDPWPLAFWTDRLAVVDKHPEARVWLRMQREPGAVVERPWLPEGFVPEDYGTHRRDPARPEPRDIGASLLAQRPGHLALSVDAPRPGMVVAVEAYAPGWSATVDGAPASVMRSNVIFMAVPVAAGTHTITLDYDPSGVVALWWMWVLVLVGVTVVGATSVARRDSRQRSVTLGSTTS